MNYDPVAFRMIALGGSKELGRVKAERVDWIALAHDESSVVATGKSFAEAVENAERKGESDPILTYVAATPVAVHQIALKSGQDRQVERMKSELERVKAERDRLRLALGKAARILHSDALRNQHQIAALHGFLYCGEAFTKEEYEKAIGDGDF